MALEYGALVCKVEHVCVHTLSQMVLSRTHGDEKMGKEENRC